MLRILLDLESVFRPQLPKVLGQLTGSRYHGLRWTCLELLPSFVSKFLNLQLLDVKHTYISTLPSSTWKMQQLLRGVFIDEDSPVKNSLDTLLNLRKLGLALRLVSPGKDELM